MRQHGFPILMAAAIVGPRDCQQHTRSRLVQHLSDQMSTAGYVAELAPLGRYHASLITVHDGLLCERPQLVHGMRDSYTQGAKPKGCKG